ncbi:MAG: neutral/alkaline non-lysosomal ceramidase N-terminal domain-containing protein [Lentisphaeria bacterium]|nr:neutral/alkaline non-lysosomal ceramidase N-terminal domain-containing protein [Lentisphaeria bacterium]
MSEQLYCGWGRTDITPKVPVSLAGYFNIRMWEKILDRLEARAIVFKQGDKYAGIVNLDLISSAQILVDRVWKKIADLTMFSKENLIFCSTHTHTGPEIRSTVLSGSEECAEDIAGAISQALRNALKDLQAVDSMVQGETYDNRFIFNRRYWMKSGGVVTNPGKFNSDILRSEGTVDAEIPMFGVKRNGKLALLFANIVNHSDTIGGNNVSADWPGFARRMIESQMPEGFMFVPVIGTAGNINHFDVASDLNQTCYAEAERIGSGIAATILNAINTLKPCCEMPLETRFTELYCPAHEVSDEEYNEALATVEKYKDEPDVSKADELTSEDLARKVPKVLKYFAQQVLLLRDEPKNANFPLPVILLNGVAVVGVPGEPFVEIGLEIRKRIFNDYRTLVAGHGPTGHPQLGGGYMPNIWNYNRGGYETTGRSNPFCTQASEMLLEAMKKLAKRS